MKETAVFPGLDVLRRTRGYSSLGDNDRIFLERVYSSAPEKYFRKLNSLGFSGLGRVADIGCGFGQWSFCLSHLNAAVEAVEPQAQRAEFLRELARETGNPEINVQTGTCESVPLPDASLDGVFCFGVLQYADPARALKEFRRVLKPGGTAYILGKDAGGYLFDWHECPNPLKTWDPRSVAFSAFANTYFLKTRGALYAGAPHTDRIIAQTELCAAALEHGFKIVSAAPEGRFSVDPGRYPGIHFFQPEYRGLPNSYEVLVQKP